LQKLLSLKRQQRQSLKPPQLPRLRQPLQPPMKIALLLKLLTTLTSLKPRWLN
jgi:hypothetical protein